MQVNVTFRHLDSSDMLKSFAREKVERVGKLLDHATEAHVILSVEKHLHHAEVLVHSGPFHLRSKEHSGDMYASIGLAVDKIERQAKRFKQRLRQHRPAGHHNVEAVRVRQQILEAPEQEAIDAAELVAKAEPPPHSRIVQTNDLTARLMSVDEAVLQLQLLDDDFLVFTNVTTNHIGIVYRRKGEGSFGLIDAVPAR